MICPYLRSRLFRHYFWNLGCRVLFWVVFSSAEWFRTEFREFDSIIFLRNGIPSCFRFCWGFGREFWECAFIFVPRNGIWGCFLFRLSVQMGIPRVCFYFNSTERNSELFSLPQKGSERNSERFLFRGIAGIPSEITIYSIYSVFRGIIFSSDIPNPNQESTFARIYRPSCRENKP